MKKISLLAFVLVLLPSILVATQFHIHVKASSGLFSHEPIFIDGNQNFTLENGVTRGSGTTEDPFIIENWDINATLGHGIHIKNTDAYFVIRNIWVHDGYQEINQPFSYYNGIFFEHVSNGRIENTRTTNNEYDIFLGYCFYIDIMDCSTLNYRSGSIRLDGSSHNNISHNNLTQINTGIDLWGYCYYNKIVGNEILNNNVGIMIFRSCNNVVANNTISKSNGNGHIGIKIWESCNNEISGNVVSNNERGIFLFTQATGESYDNKIFLNVLNHNHYGIYTEYQIPQLHFNLICHNGFINNTNQVYAEGTNVWDDGYPSGGNYWSDYNGTDFYSGSHQNVTGSDGIGDTPYNIDGDDRDNYPLMGMVSVFNATNLQCRVQTICISTISAFQFNGTAISFNISGENGTTGFCRICIPTNLMNGTYIIFVKGIEVSYTLLPCSNNTHSYLYFTYNHSTQEVTIIPEFPTWASMLLILIVLTVATAIYKRRLSKHQSTKQLSSFPFPNSQYLLRLMFLPKFYLFFEN